MQCSLVLLFVKTTSDKGISSTLLWLTDAMPLPFNLRYIFICIEKKDEKKIRTSEPFSVDVFRFLSVYVSLIHLHYSHYLNTSTVFTEF